MGKLLSWAAPPSSAFLCGPPWASRPCLLVMLHLHCHLPRNREALHDRNLSLLTPLGVDQEKSKRPMLSMLSSAADVLKEEVLRVISSCLQNEQVTQIHCALAGAAS